MELRGRRILVVGLGASGLAAVRLLASRGARVVANDLRSETELGDRAEAAREAGAELVLGSHDASLFTSVDRIVLSPGVPPLAALDAADAAGIPIASEIELASWFLEGATVVAITGTNGKSTVTTLVGEMCRRSGRPTFVGGNLGTPLVEVVGQEAAKRGGYVVVELSSFQLERVDRFRADVSVLLNVTEDHLDRYASFSDYAAAKSNIFSGQRRADVAVVPAGDSVCLALARAGAAEVHRFGAPDGEVRVEHGSIQDRTTGWQLPTEALRIRGAHNLENACAAVLAARLAEVPTAAIEATLREFSGLPHRMQWVREIDEVAFFDDSKATNVGAAVAAIEGFDGRGKVVLLAGGKDKGGSYAPLAESLSRKGRALVLLGEASPLIAAAVEGTGLPIARATTMEEAVRQALELASPGDAVVLAPACSSFDMFRSYAERGDVFHRAVLALPEKAR